MVTRILVSSDIKAIWNSHKGWRESFKTENIDEVENIINDMKRILGGQEMNLNMDSTWSSVTLRSLNVVYDPWWYADKLESWPFENYTKALRKEGLDSLIPYKSPTLEEMAVIENFGSDVAKMIKELLLDWFTKMNEIRSVIPLNEEMCESLASLKSISDYSREFTDLWKRKFVDYCVSAAFSLDNAMAILSTGTSAKIFFCIMLVNRLIAADHFRTGRRRLRGVSRIEPEDLPDEGAECLICQEQFGVPDENGHEDIPVRTVACCGGYFGEACLRQWYGDNESPNRNCPLCRKPVTKSVLYALGLGDYEDNDDDDDDDDDDVESETGEEYDGWSEESQEVEEYDEWSEESQGEEEGDEYNGDDGYGEEEEEGGEVEGEQGGVFNQDDMDWE